MVRSSKNARPRVITALRSLSSGTRSRAMRVGLAAMDTQLVADLGWRIPPMSAPSTKPNGPVRRIPSSGPKLALGLIISGPKKPTTRPTPPTKNPARQLERMRVRLSIRSPATADHQQSSPIVASQEVLGTQKIQPSLLGRLRFRKAIHPARARSAVPSPAKAMRRMPKSAGGAMDFTPRLPVVGLTDRPSTAATSPAGLSYVPKNLKRASGRVRRDGPFAG